MIEILNLTNFKIKKKDFSQLAKKILLGENKGKGGVSLVFIKESEIRRLNRKFRGRNEATDVLSFPLINCPAATNYLGEIFISPYVVLKQARRYRTDFREELKRVFIHGLLHLLGYDHNNRKEAKRMKKLEEYYLNL